MGKLRKELTRKFGEEKVKFLEKEAECLETFTKEEIRVIKEVVANEIEALGCWAVSTDRETLSGALSKMH